MAFKRQPVVLHDSQYARRVHGRLAIGPQPSFLLRGFLRALRRGSPGRLRPLDDVMGSLRDTIRN